MDKDAILNVIRNTNGADLAALAAARADQTFPEANAKLERIVFAVGFTDAFIYLLKVGNGTLKP